MPLLGAIAGCHCWGAIAGVPWLGCHGWVPLLDASYQLWRSSRWVPLLGAIAGVPLLVCHGWVPLLDAIKLGGVHVGCHCWVACRGAIARCHTYGLCYLGSMLV